MPIACAIKEVPLRKELVTEFGLVEDSGEESQSVNNGTELAVRATGTDQSVAR